MPIRCERRICGKEGVVIPTMVIPIKNHPLPVYMQARFALCRDHALAFTMREYDDIAGRQGWYEAAADMIRARKKPAVNPFPNDPNFQFRPFIVTPNWEPVPKEQCYIIFQDVRVLDAKGLSQLYPGFRKIPGT